jgi:hypothetical protein
MSERPVTSAAVVFGILLAAGLVLAGAQLKQAALEVKRAERFVTVKGLSEREVKADTATWPISFSTAADDLASAYAKSDADNKQILAFLANGGLKSSEIELGVPDVSDTRAGSFGPERSGPRFIVGQVITVYTKQVDLVATLSARIAELVKKGVVLGRTSGPTYHFTGVNRIKPAMLAEATKAARAAAAQFAADSGATVGDIRRATQGALSIVPLEGFGGGGDEGGFQGQAEHWIRQRVRVVMTVDFLLEH